MKRNLLAPIIFNRQIAPGCYRMRILCPDLARRSAAGQFVMARVGTSSDPLLRRPFAVNRTCREKGAGDTRRPPSCIEILYRTVGKGTALLAEKKPGQTIDLLGPLGNGFRLPRPGRRAVLVAGGMGVAPLLSLACALGEKKGSPGRTTGSLVFIGGKTRDDLLCLNDFSKAGAKVAVGTEDGSSGSKGLITDLLERFLSALTPADAARIALYACGPVPMLERVAAIARDRAIHCQVSLESCMACGVGACLGCSVPTRVNREGTISYQRVCREGPVFDSAAIAWECLNPFAAASGE